MSEICREKGCRYLQTICAMCGRIVSTATFPKAMEWISIKDRKPLLGIQHRYLFINGKGEATFGYAYADDEHGHGTWDTGCERSIWINDLDRQTNEIATHWMPLPEGPKYV